MAEERGFECLLFPEHTHIPASRESSWPGGEELPSYYARTYDPFVALTAAAAATDRLLIGTGICLVIERDPIITAKEVASVDVLSGGRFLFGVGAGWNVEEMRNHGTDAVDALPADARADRGDEGDLDAGRGQLLRRARLLRADLVLAEAGAEASPAGPGRRQRPSRAGPGARVRGRVDAEPHGRRGAGGAHRRAERPRHGARSRPHSGDRDGHARPTRRGSTGLRRRASIAWSSGCPRRARTPSRRASTATPA